MTKEEFNKKFDELLSDGYLEKYIKEKKDFLLKCEAIDLENMPNDYSFPKDVLSVCLERLSILFSPTTGCSDYVQRKSKKNKQRIKCFI